MLGVLAEVNHHQAHGVLRLVSREISYRVFTVPALLGILSHERTDGPFST